ncbi:MAG: 5-bromo-4-chloroindolyl phosphate hydrolysis family protein [Oscillospiraceae bacterium]|nr:5-bromo-4-chloroindolyl phosphate hydrolysis family protein [Oscillospiraceae bacterium]
MSYRYEPGKGFDRKKPDNDIGSWVFIGIMFMVFWPVGLFLLISKLTDEKKPTRTARTDSAEASAAGQKAEQTAPKGEVGSAPKAKAAPKKKKVTATPQYGQRGTRIMSIVGIVLTVLGALVGLGVLSDLSFYFGEYGDLMWFLEDLSPCLGLLSGGIALLLGGRSMKRRARRFAKYRTVTGTRKAVSIAELASAADVRMAKAERDLELMVERGLWGPQAYVDNGQDMLFLTAEAAREYHEMRHVRAKPPQETKAAPETESDNAFRISAIRRANDRIDDAALSAKIDRLEQVTGRIFRFIEANPAAADKANTFLNYYLPTTQKLLDSYADFEEAGISGENLDKAKERIEQTMDSIISGFEHQLDELYRDAALDIDSDIRVMETMLRRDTASVADDFGLDGGTAVQRE